MNISRPHVVFDCNVLFQALSRQHGPAAQCLLIAERNQVTLCLSKPILRELRKILAYPEIRAKNPHVTDAVINEFVAHLLFRAVLTRDVPHVIDFSRDSGDEPYLDLAVATNAEYLVTRDKDLLSLPKVHSITAQQLRQRCPSLRIVTPSEFAAALAPPV